MSSLIRAAAALGFPRVILAMALRISSLERQISIDGVWSSGNKSSCGIIPGSVFATDCMRAVMLPVFARLQAASPHIDMGLYVDDAALRHVGEARACVGQLAVDVRRFIGIAEDEFGWEVSRRRGLGQDWGKSVELTRTGPARKLASQGFDGMGIKTDSGAAYLGVDYAAGCRRRATKVKTRWAAIHSRSGRVRTAQKARGLVHKVVRRGMVPGVLYGAAIRGVGNAMRARATHGRQRAAVRHGWRQIQNGRPCVI